MIQLLTLLFTLSSVAKADFCTFKGCANVTVCTCIPYLQFCEVSENKEGLCTLTGTGMAVGTSLISVLLVLLALAIFCCCCCWCCKRKGAAAPIYVNTGGGGDYKHIK